MKFNTRILSTFLAVVMLIGAIGSFTILTTFAEEVVNNVKIDDYVKTVYNTPEDKIATMNKMLSEKGYELYVDAKSGEVAAVETVSGNILFSNPYDVASSTGSASTKGQILSQVVIQYTDNGTTKYLYSYNEAAVRNQIKVMNIKNGVRVEYTIGREESRKLVPRQILNSSFKTYIQEPLQAAVSRKELSEYTYNRIMSFYTDYSIDNPALAKRTISSLKITYPILEEIDEDNPSQHNTLWVITSDVSSTELNFLEENIKLYCEDYTFEQMDLDHEAARYEAPDEQYPLFKMALEYSIDENGLSVRMPCNGLRYDMSTYTLEYISILPYMGSGNSKNAGYNFYPDGSGSLFDFEQLNTKSTTTVRGKVYGIDYAYHEITGATYQKTIRYPVYGTVATEKIYNYTYTDNTGKSITESVSNTVKTSEKIMEELDKNGSVLTSGNLEETANVYQRGYLAIIESGESLAEISTYHAGSLSDYNTMINYFNPKPKDSYDISDSISVTTSSTWTVVSERKYTGSITIRYLMLGDENVTETVQAIDSTYTAYETSWLGMAEAYRDYLINKGYLDKIDSEDIEDNYTPLYIETFGAIEVQKTIATIPVNVMTPLTTFEDLYTMYTDLADAGVKNINFKMTGYANGGMYNDMPYKLKWEGAVGGKSGFKELVETANEINNTNDGSHLGLYPDFDFAYVQGSSSFDGLKLKRDAAKTIDNRYTSLRSYSATQQEYVSFYQLAISPSRYEHFYTKFMKNYSKYDIDTISVASLGKTLNSDFDEDEPFNREDNKEFTIAALEAINENYSIMSEDVNAFAIGYVDQLLNVSLDSSRYVKSAASVPFVGVLLHGYVQFAGPAFNEEGDTSYAILRAIENGAYLYFILSYENIQYLKEDSLLSQYYSVRYDIWKDDVVTYYNELNEALKDVQTKVIIDHEFLVGERVLDNDELEAEIQELLKKAIEEEKIAQKNKETANALKVANAWTNAFNAETYIDNLLLQMDDLNDSIVESALLLALEDALGEENAESPFVKLATTATIYAEAIYAEEGAKEAKTAFVNAITSARSKLKNFLTLRSQLQATYDSIKERIDAFDEYIEIITNSNLDDTVKANMLLKVNAYKAAVASKLTEAQTKLDLNKTYFDETSADYVGKWADTGFKKIGVNKFLEVEKDTDLEINIAGAPIYDNAYDEAYATVQEVIASEAFTMQEVIASVNVQATQDTTDDTTQEKNDRYIVDNNQIVAVTYGDRNDTTFEKTAYKTFLLNYNNYAVRVTYDGTAYTIPSGGYIVIYPTTT